MLTTSPVSPTKPTPVASPTPIMALSPSTHHPALHGAKKLSPPMTPPISWLWGWASRIPSTSYQSTTLLTDTPPRSGNMQARFTAIRIVTVSPIRKVLDTIVTAGLAVFHSNSTANLQWKWMRLCWKASASRRYLELRVSSICVFGDLQFYWRLDPGMKGESLRIEIQVSQYHRWWYHVKTSHACVPISVISSNNSDDLTPNLSE